MRLNRSSNGQQTTKRRTIEKTLFLSLLVCPKLGVAFCSIQDIAEDGGVRETPVASRHNEKLNSHNFSVGVILGSCFFTDQANDVTARRRAKLRFLPRLFQARLPKSRRAMDGRQRFLLD